ncbi:TIGR03790 family protein [Bradyrhizobium sp. McL0615]|uniref:TIGR03790 family protein n=1 Tax=Bradyrhizobium sp. McL0615 TaxID=3415673 RepID=UPI003CF79B83
MLKKIDRVLVVDRLSLAAAYFVLASLLLPNFAAAQSPQKTEALEVLDANSIKVATLIVPRSSIQTSEIAVLINDNDPQSVEVASYYQQVRMIPGRNMIHLSFDQDKIYPGLKSNNGIDPAEFASLKAQVDAAAGRDIQAFVVSWSRPFRIARFNYYSTNYSITSAFAFGIDTPTLTSNNCSATPLNPYFASSSTAPFTDFGIRPTMMLAGQSAASVKATIDKGLKADRSLPGGNGWFVRTADSVRSGPRLQDFQATVQNWNRPEALSMMYLDYSKNGGRSEVKNAADILFYQTGSANVSGINTNTYIPGALADHLTSSGGNLFGTEQMSALRWLEAGATASYGTVTEPCAYADKFPAASVLVKSYFRGNTALEAYTKSVRQPSQGIFVGDPLARPFGTRATLVNGVLNIKTSSLEPGINYNLYAAPSATGPYLKIATVAVPRFQFATITVPGKSAPFYKLEMSGSFPTPSSAGARPPSE